LTKRLKLTSILVVLLFGLISLALSAGRPPVCVSHTVVIDAGHGGVDPGAIGSEGACEKHINLAIAQLVYLEAMNHPGLNVVLTRDDDVTLPNADRILGANRLGADLYVSIHVNAFSMPNVSGIETLIHETVPISAPSFRLAEILQGELVAATGAPDRGVKRASLYLRRGSMPAALVEVGFLTNPGERRRLQTLRYQEEIAEALLHGILAFLDGD
jgi:N-acetylmuramoyl-L-alanine amidase